MGCPTIRAESDLICNFLAPVDLAKLILARTTLYSTTLFEALKPKQKSCLVTSPYGDYRTTLSPPLALFEAPSTWIIQGWRWLLSGDVSSSCAGIIHSTKIDQYLLLH